MRVETAMAITSAATTSAARQPGLDSVRQIGDRAVVLGASMAGLLAARVPTEHYAQVTVIGRDELPKTPTHRRGIPRGRHIHALAARGLQILEELFPGLTTELVTGGAALGDMLTDARFYFSGHRMRQAHSGLLLLCASRPFLEQQVRAKVQAHVNLQILAGYDVVGLDTASDDGRRVIGVQVLPRADGSAEEHIGADLVVDASGRGSRIPAWLESLGYQRPERDEVRIGLGYATRTYRLAADALDGNLAVLDAATPENPRTGALQRLEGDRWMLTLAGILGNSLTHPPIPTPSRLSPDRFGSPTSTGPSATRTRWMPRSPSASRPACVTATSEGTGSPPV